MSEQKVKNHVLFNKIASAGIDKVHCISQQTAGKESIDANIQNTKQTKFVSKKSLKKLHSNIKTWP